MSALAIAGRPAKRPNYRLRRRLGEAAALAFSIPVLIWTLTPIYNIVAVALEPKGDVFTNEVFPANPSFESFWIVFTQCYWYLEYFWHQFANSLYIGLATVAITLTVGLAKNGSSTADFGSGTASMSEALIACHPRIEEPSNPRPSSKMLSSSVSIG